MEEIWTWFPILKNELESSKMSTDYIELKFKNGSLFHILALSASARGQRATGGKPFHNAAQAKHKLVKKMVKLFDKQRLALAS